jgi:superfamily II DNA helicase RecQ
MVYFMRRRSSASRSQEQLKLQYYSEQHGNETVYEELCSWRRGKASSERKAPYILASNRLLRMISAFLPRTAEELLQIPGVGEGKASVWRRLAQYHLCCAREHHFPLNWVMRRLMRRDFVFLAVQAEGAQIQEAA